MIHNVFRAFFVKILAIFWLFPNSYAPQATEIDESSRCHKGEMRLKDRSAFEGIGGVDTVNVELHPHLTTQLRERYPVGERLHDKNSLTLDLVVHRTETGIVETTTLVTHLDEHSSTTGTQRDGHRL